MKRLILALPLILAACTDPDEKDLIGRWEAQHPSCELEPHMCGITISLHETALASVYAQFDDRKMVKIYPKGTTVVGAVHDEYKKGPGGPVIMRGTDRNGTVFSILNATVSGNAMSLVYKNGKLYTMHNMIFERKEQ